MKKLVIALVVLAALLVAADRILVSAAEGVVARRVQVAADLERQPTVQIRGFPFLTQAVRGVYRRVEISLTALGRGDTRLEDLRVRLRDVHAPLAQMLNRDGSVTVRAESARATAVVPFAVLERRIPGDIEVNPQGDRLRLTGEVTIAGRSVPASAVVEPSVSEGRLVFTATAVTAAGATVTDRLGERFSFTVEVGQLPFGLHLTGVRVTGGGVRVIAAGTDLLLTGPDAAAVACAVRTPTPDRTGCAGSYVS